MERFFFSRLPDCSKEKTLCGHYNLLTLTLLRTWAGIFRSNVGGKCLYNLHLRLHMHLVVWGCKHPRLEAVCTTELSVWCLRLLATPYCQVNLFIQYSLKSIPDLDTVLLLKCSFVFSCSLSSCKHPTLSCYWLPQRLRGGCLLELVGNDTWT